MPLPLKAKPAHPSPFQLAFLSSIVVGGISSIFQLTFSAQFSQGQFPKVKLFQFWISTQFFRTIFSRSISQGQTFPILDFNTIFQLWIFVLKSLLFNQQIFQYFFLKMNKYTVTNSGFQHTFPKLNIYVGFTSKIFDRHIKTWRIL